MGEDLGTGLQPCATRTRYPVHRSCPWGPCGDGPERGLVGFLWGTPEPFVGSRSRPFRDSGFRFPGLTYPADLRILTGAGCRAD